MGWWWNSNHTKDTFASAKEQQPPATEAPIFNPASEPRQLESPVLEEAKHILTRDEQSNQDLIAFLKELQSQTEEKRILEEKTSKFSPIESAPASATEDISPDSLYPATIHCRSAFDYAFFCQSFGGQFVNVYRYGGFRSCSNHWQDFWLCMRTKNWNEQDRAKAIKDHYKQKAIRYKKGPSSEDVWDLRKEPVKDAFQADLEALEERIEEWKKANPNEKNPW